MWAEAVPGEVGTSFDNLPEPSAALQLLVGRGRRRARGAPGAGSGRLDANRAPIPRQSRQLLDTHVCR
jgi:hypothetical protein